jgi:hypothetical protein
VSFFRATGCIVCVLVVVAWFGRHREGWHDPRRFSFVASRKDRFMGLWLWVMYINVACQDIAPFVQRHLTAVSGQRFPPDDPPDAPALP